MTTMHSDINVGMSILPCIIFSLIMIISFLLCRCEYIGEVLAKKGVCAWKRNRTIGINSKKKCLNKYDVAKLINDEDTGNREIIGPCHSQSIAPSLRHDGDSSDGSELDNDPPPAYENCVKKKKLD